MPATSTSTLLSYQCTSSSSSIHRLTPPVKLSLWRCRSLVYCYHLALCHNNLLLVQETTASQLLRCLPEKPVYLSPAQGVFVLRQTGRLAQNLPLMNTIEYATAFDFLSSQRCRSLVCCYHLHVAGVFQYVACICGTLPFLFAVNLGASFLHAWGSASIGIGD